MQRFPLNMHEIDLSAILVEAGESHDPAQRIQACEEGEI